MRLSGILSAALVAACASQPTRPSSPEERKPTPGTVTRENPAGDAAQPVDAALTRLLAEPMGNHADKFETLQVPLADRPHWRRVRFIGYPTRAAFRYGDEHYAVVMLDYSAADGNDAPTACLSRFVDRAYDLAHQFDLEVDAVEQGLRSHADEAERVAWRASAARDSGSGSPIPFVRASGHFTTLTNRDRYFSAMVSYSSWPGTCLVQAFAVRVGSDETLAGRVVDRWIGKLAPQLRWTGSLRGAPPFENR